MAFKAFSGILILFIIATSACTDGFSTSDNEIEEVTFRPLSTDKSPSELFTDLIEMIGLTEEMSREELENLEEDDLWELSKPLLLLWKDTIDLNQNIIADIQNPIHKIRELSKTGQLDRDVHSGLSAEISKAITSYRYVRRQRMEPHLNVVQDLLINWNSEQSKETVCDVLFNTIGDSKIILMPGDNLEAANYFCSEGTFFYISEGLYSGQSVTSPKPGNFWIGAGSTITVLDGLNSTNYAFRGRTNNNTFSHFEIRNYSLFAIHSNDKDGNGNVEISNILFSHIGEELNGQEYGAILVEWMKNLLVKDSGFENVTSAVRFVNSEGPLQVIGNRALNPGRNFFQCDKCYGKGIRINNNSMESTEQFGSDLLEDYINIFKSEGDPDDWIQVNYNKARGHAGSLSGSFLILGDGGGKYQSAYGNIGVNPGQVGIGIAGGEYMRVENNLMYSEPWSASNVGFYSAGYTKPCSNHTFPGPQEGNPNRANWIRANGTPNSSWTDGKCGIENPELRSNVLTDTTLTPDIWNTLLNYKK